MRDEFSAVRSEMHAIRDEIRLDIGGLATHVVDLQTQVGELRTQFDDLRTKVGDLREAIGAVRTDTATAILGTEERLVAHMRALHEDVVTRIAGIGEGQPERPRGVAAKKRPARLRRKSR